MNRTDRHPLKIAISQNEITSAAAWKLAALQDGRPNTQFAKPFPKHTHI